MHARPILGPDRKPIFAMQRVHFRVRRLYARQHGMLIAPLFIDWTEIVNWIVANWDTIIRIILAILPFFIF